MCTFDKWNISNFCEDLTSLPLPSDGADTCNCIFSVEFVNLLAFDTLQQAYVTIWWHMQYERKCTTIMFYWLLCTSPIFLEVIHVTANEYGPLDVLNCSFPFITPSVNSPLCWFLTPIAQSLKVTLLAWKDEEGEKNLRGSIPIHLSHLHACLYTPSDKEHGSLVIAPYQLQMSPLSCLHRAWPLHGNGLWDFHHNHAAPIAVMSADRRGDTAKRWNSSAFFSSDSKVSEKNNRQYG